MPDSDYADLLGLGLTSEVFIMRFVVYCTYSPTVVYSLEFNFRRHLCNRSCSLRLC